MPTTAPEWSTGNPTSIAAGESFTTTVLSVLGIESISVTAELTQVGEIIVQGFRDFSGLVPAGVAFSTLLAASTVATLHVDTSNSTPFQTFSVTLVNKGTDATTVSNFALAMLSTVSAP